MTSMAEAYMPRGMGGNVVSKIIAQRWRALNVMIKLLSSSPYLQTTMSMNSSVNEFILLGLTQDPRKQKAIFGVFLMFYLATLLGNFLIVVTIKRSRTLGSPMYFFLFYLSFADACFSTTIAPRLIVDAISQQKTISYNECMTQVFAVHFFACMGIFVLILMAFDRYVAICKHVCSVLVTLGWVGSCIHSSAQIVLALKLPFCGPNMIDHYFCDLQPLLKLACMDTYVINLLVVTNSGAICMVSFIILLISYVIILYSLRNYSAEGRRKALSTCTSHFIVVVLCFGPCIFIYTRPATTFPVDKVVAVFYTIGTPLLNPLIYTLRNAEVKIAMKMLWCSKV
uniref:Olfactory receptor n=1 Tax=Canis lupus familiaris TaxID=9615 RepID=A0A8I3RU85_CANLF